MRTKEIKKLRMNLGKFLHEYYIKFGEEKYEKFLEKLGSTLESEYGESFSDENMRIMEAEFVTFNQKIKDIPEIEESSEVEESQEDTKE